MLYGNARRIKVNYFMKIRYVLKLNLGNFSRGLNVSGLALKNPTQKNPPNKTQKTHLKKSSPVWVFLGFISFYSKYVFSIYYVYLNTVCKVLHRQNIP